jgi:hypothetical protein
MIGAAVTHCRHGETDRLAVPVALFLMTVVVVLG